MQCALDGVLYDHGVMISPRQCIKCECSNGKFQCASVNPETECPPLSCPEEKQFSVPGECCKFCEGVDYCAQGHTCHPNASCINLQINYTCHCNDGFTGEDGQYCTGKILLSICNITINIHNIKKSDNYFILFKYKKKQEHAL